MGGRRGRPSAREVVRALRAAEWGDRALFAGALGAVVLLIGVGVWAGRDGVDGVRALTTGVRGTVTVRECTISDAVKDPQFWTSGWDCSGAFDGDGGRLHIDHVKVFLHADRRPGPTLPGRVSGPGAGWVWPDGGIEWVFALALAVGVTVPAWWCLRAAIEEIEPVRGWPRRRKRSSIPGPRGSQLGNRARRRRRKRKR